MSWFECLDPVTMRECAETVMGNPASLKSVENGDGCGTNVSGMRGRVSREPEDLLATKARTE